MKKLIFLLFAAALFPSCKDSKTDLPATGLFSFISESYVLGYYNLKDVFISGDASLIEIYEGDFTDDGATVFNEPAVMRRFCESIGDTAFNQMLVRGGSRNLFIGQKYKSLSVVSDYQFDEQHPAGSDLSDLCTFYTVTPWPYIKSKYEDFFDWDSYGHQPEFGEIFHDLFYYPSGAGHPTNGKEYVHPVMKTANELTQDDFTLLGRGERVTEMNRYLFDPFAAIKFNKVPDENKKHTITLTFTDESDKKIVSNTLTLEF